MPGLGLVRAAQFDVTIVLTLFVEFAQVGLKLLSDDLLLKAAHEVVLLHGPPHGVHALRDRLLDGLILREQHVLRVAGRIPRSIGHLGEVLEALPLRLADHRLCAALLGRVDPLGLEVVRHQRLALDAVAGLLPHRRRLDLRA